MTGTKVTLADVAASAGVSVGTVDRVINARGNVRPETEQLVLKVAREMRLDRALDLRPTRILRLGVLLQNKTNPFYKGLVAAFLKSASDYRYLNVEVRLYFYERLDRHDIAAKITAAEAACDGLVVDVFDEPSIRTKLNAAAASKPIFTLASDLPYTDRVSYVGVDARAEGRVAGELMGRFVGSAGGEIILISGLQSFHAHEQREMGFRSVLRERFPNCSVTIALESKEDDGTTRRRIRALLSDHPQVAGIYNISVGSPEIGEVLCDLKKEYTTTFITHELTEENRSLLERGILDAVIDQDHATEALIAVQRFLSFYGRLDLEHDQPGFQIFLRENCHRRERVAS